MKIFACLLFSLTFLLPADRPRAEFWRSAENRARAAGGADGADGAPGAEFGAADARFLISFLESFRSCALSPRGSHQLEFPRAGSASTASRVGMAGAQSSCRVSGSFNSELRFRSAELPSANAATMPCCALPFRLSHPYGATLPPFRAGRPISGRRILPAQNCPTVPEVPRRRSGAHPLRPTMRVDLFRIACFRPVSRYSATEYVRRFRSVWCARSSLWPRLCNEPT